MMKQILIVEDEILIQQSLKILLEQKGFSVQAVSSGKEAIQKILGEDFNLILCDLMLQDISGFDILDESFVKYDKEQIKKKFILMSAYRTENLMEKIQHYGCLFIEKPFVDLSTTLDMITSEYKSEE
jgi:CheY-like chemotaxis protein